MLLNLLLGSQAVLQAADVFITDNGRSWTLDNGVVKATVTKGSGTLSSLIYRGIQTVGGGGYWEETPQGAPQVINSITIDPAKNSGARAEVSVKGITGGTVMLSPGAPGGGTFCDIEVRYALGRGDSGVYAYAIFSHPASYPAMGIGESRYIVKLSHDFDWLSVDQDRNLLECSPQDWGKGVVVHAKEQRILSTGPYKNSVEHKYSYTAVQYKTPAFGWSSTKNHIGVWFVNPTTEFLSGGASKLELVCHLDANDNPDPIILDYWRGTHFGGGANCNMASGENWSKVIGPIFVYCNGLDHPMETLAQELDALAATAGDPMVPASWKQNATLLWKDALGKAAEQKGAWPFDWVNGVDYPHRSERGQVSGQFILDDPQAASHKLPHLTVGLAHADYTGSRGRGGNGVIDWAHDAKFYQFWNDGDDDGHFTITNARPGSYTLHAFADGVLGEFSQVDVQVVAGKTLDLGKINWRPVRYGKQVWEIGYPNRTADKFFKGDGDNYWLWGWGVRYGDLFPQDITYTIGVSDYHKDWFFQQVPHELSDAWKNPQAKDPLHQRFGWMKTAEAGENVWRTISQGRATPWTVKFKMPGPVKGQAALRIALAGADGNGGLGIAVNGSDVGTVYPVSTNALRYNTNKSVWNEYTQKFDAAILKSGDNVLTLTVPAGEVTSGVVYDYLRLELNEAP